MYIRKLSKNSTIYKLQENEDVNNLDADILKQELATSGNTLSFWKCEDEANIDDAVKAILLSTTSIESSRFIILDDDLLEKYGIDTDDKALGKTGYKGFENLHIDFCNLTYEKIGKILAMMKEVVHDKKRIPQIKKEEVKKIIQDVIDAGLLNWNEITPQLKQSICKYIVKE